MGSVSTRKMKGARGCRDGDRFSPDLFGIDLDVEAKHLAQKFGPG